MPQKLDKLNTGSKDFDDDLRELFAICEDKKKLNTIKQAIDNKNISSEEFSKIVPQSLIKLSLFLVEPQFSINLEQINKEAVGLVKKANSLFEKHFGNLVENKIAKSMLKNIVKAQQADSESLDDEVIRRIGYYLVWEGNPPKLTPAVRIAFKNRKGKILLNTELDWDDLSFLLEELSKIFLNLLEKGKVLAKSRQLDLLYSEKVAKSIEATLKKQQKIKKIMPIYKAKTGTDKNKRSVKDSSSQN